MSYVNKDTRQLVLDLRGDPAALAAAMHYIRELGRKEGHLADAIESDIYESIGRGYDPWHHCHFCGEHIAFGYEANGKRHYLSDCRPDLVKHDVGPTCTWPDHAADESEGVRHRSCYAYQDGVNGPWTDEHIHFHEDGPM